jgi:hypothetical protein
VVVMKKLRAGWMLGLLAALALMAGSAVAQDLMPQPTEQELIDVPNDDGSRLGLLSVWTAARHPAP